MREEALKCAINSVYSRPDFIEAVLVTHDFAPRLLALAKQCGVASFHLLVWKTLLVSCDASSTIAYLCDSLDAWTLIYTVRTQLIHLHFLALQLTIQLHLRVSATLLFLFRPTNCELRLQTTRHVRV